MNEELEKLDEDQDQLEQLDENQSQLIEIYKIQTQLVNSVSNRLKCHRLFRPQFRKFNPSFAARIP